MLPQGTNYEIQYRGNFFPNQIFFIPLKNFQNVNIKNDLAIFI
jgi:hypothetical protein